MYTIRVEKCKADKKYKKLSENNAMCFHTEISAPEVYWNDTIKTVLFSGITACQGTV